MKYWMGFVAYEVKKYIDTVFKRKTCIATKGFIMNFFFRFHLAPLHFFIFLKGSYSSTQELYEIY